MEEVVFAATRGDIADQIRKDQRRSSVVKNPNQKNLLGTVFGITGRRLIRIILFYGSHKNDRFLFWAPVTKYGGDSRCSWCHQ